MSATDRGPGGDTNALDTRSGGVSTLRSDVRDEQDACHRPGRIPQPPTDQRSTGRKRGIEHGRMSTDLPACTVGVGQDKDAPDDEWSPAESGVRDRLPDQPGLLVELPKRLLGSGEIGLDLLDHRGPSIASGPEEVDRPALAVLRVADFRKDVPSAPDEPDRRCLDERGVPRIDKTVESRTAPKHLPIEPRADHPEDRSEGFQRDRSAVPVLDGRDQRLRDASANRDIGLAKPSAKAKRAQRSPYPMIIHAPMFGASASLTLIPTLPSPASAESVPGISRVCARLPEASR